MAQQSESQSSVNNDWKNWLLLHGSDTVAHEDLMGIGKEIGLNFDGVNNNRFDILSGVSRNNKEGVGNGK